VKISIKEIKNNMVINIKSQTDLSGFYIVFNSGSVIETKGYYGVSHLSEHLIYHHLDDLLDDFDTYGISNNAYTSDNNVVIYFTGLDEHLNKFKNLILDKLLTFNISEKIFNNEKNIVLKEYFNSFNSITSSHFLNLNRKLFDLYRPIGLREDLENLTYENWKNFFIKNFSTPAKIINVSKNFNFESDITLIDIEPKKNVKFNINNDFIKEDTISYESKNTSFIALSNLISDDFPYIKFINAMLGQGLKSPLYQEIREKRGLVYYISMYLDDLTNDQGIITITTETETDKISEIQKIITEILDNPDKYLTQERFNIIKTNFEVNLKKNEINRYLNVNKYMSNEKWLLEPIIKDLTLDKIKEVYSKYYNFNTYYKSTDVEEFKN